MKQGLPPVGFASLLLLLLLHLRLRLRSLLALAERHGNTIVENVSVAVLVLVVIVVAIATVRALPKLRLCAVPLFPLLFLSSCWEADGAEGVVIFIVVIVAVNITIAILSAADAKGSGTQMPRGLSRGLVFYYVSQDLCDDTGRFPHVDCPAVVAVSGRKEELRRGVGVCGSRASRWTSAGLPFPYWCFVSRRTAAAAAVAVLKGGSKVAQSDLHLVA